MKVYAFFLILFSFFITPSFSAPDEFYANEKVVKLSWRRVTTGGWQFSFINAGHFFYVAESRHMSDEIWTPWFGEWKGVEKGEFKSHVWRGREEDSQHYFTIKKGPDMFVRVMAVKTSMWDEYVKWARDILENAD